MLQLTKFFDMFFHKSLTTAHVWILIESFLSNQKWKFTEDGVVHLKCFIFSQSFEITQLHIHSISTFVVYCIFWWNPSKFSEISRKHVTNTPEVFLIYKGQGGSWLYNKKKLFLMFTHSRPCYIISLHILISPTNAIPLSQCYLRS